MQGHELESLLNQERGQFLDFVSAYEHKKRGVEPKKVSELAREISRLLNGMVNADGGVLLVGIDPDRSVTGLPYAAEEIRRLVDAPQRLLMPPLVPSCEQIQLGNLLLLRFETSPGLEIHRLSGGRTFYRIAAENPAVPRDQIQLLKEAKHAFSYERQPVSRATWNDLNEAAIEAFAERVGIDADPREILTRYYRLVFGAESKPEISMAALLLFAKDIGRWHPRCGIDFVRYEGTERAYGPSLNIVKRLRIEEPLWTLIDEAVGRIRGHIKERMVLHDLFFREQLEYPAFAWQEALVNAVAHRDYSLAGAQIEVWMFDDRLEIRSPGLLPSPVKVEDLIRRHRVHFSRNPLIVRALADLRYVREMGEGVPRMFQEMEHNSLKPPEFTNEGFFFTVTLRNTPIYDETTLQWLNQFGRSRLNLRQQRILVYALSHGKLFSTTDYQRIVEVDRDTAYRDIRHLIKLGILEPIRPKSRTYRIVERI